MRSRTGDPPTVDSGDCEAGCAFGCATGGLDLDLARGRTGWDVDHDLRGGVALDCGDDAVEGHLGSTGEVRAGDVDFGADRSGGGTEAGDGRRTNFARDRCDDTLGVGRVESNGYTVAGAGVGRQ